MSGLKYLIQVRLFFIFFLLSAIFVLCEHSYCQTELTLPTEFQNLSTNARVLGKKFTFTLDSDTNGTSQSFVLDKTGFILHLVPSPKITNGGTKIRIFLSDGTEIQTYNFIDDTVFALVDSEKSYSIYEEIIPKCDDFVKAFEFDQSSVICPDSELLKLNENIMIDKDTSFRISLRKPEEFYSAVLTLPENTQLVKNFTNINVSLGDIGDSEPGFKRAPVNIASLLAVGKLCIVSKKKTSSITELSSCSLVNKNVNSIITFKNSLTATPSKAIITLSGIPAGTNALVVEVTFDNAVLKLGGTSADNGEIVFSDADSIRISSDINLPSTVKLTVDLTGVAVGTSPFLVKNILDMLGSSGVAIPGVMAAVDISSISVAPSSTSTYSMDKDISMGVLNVVFSLIPGRFNTLLHNYVFEFAEDIVSTDSPVEINSISPEKYFFKNNKSGFNINLGQISTVAKKNRKNIFSLTNPIELNRTLNNASFAVPLNNLDASLTLSLNKTNLNIFLNNVSLMGNENPLNAFNLSTNNNIVIKNLLDSPQKKDKQRFQITPSSSLIISSYLSDKLSNLTISRNYTFVEQIVAPSVDDKGKPIEVVNNKSKADLILLKNLSAIDLSRQISSFLLPIEKTTTLLNNASFTMQGNVSGFLLPPDFRPVLEDGYRAGVEFTMTINLTNNETLKIIYADLKTKDETPLTNFFNFSYLPLGIYDVDLKFDSDRMKLFQKGGVLKENK